MCVHSVDMLRSREMKGYSGGDEDEDEDEDE